jgi:uncharacterized protein
MPHPVVHFEISGRNQQLLESFYKDVFGWQITPVMSEYSMVAKEGDGIGGGIGYLPDNPGHVTFYVQVDDIHAALALIQSKGGQTAFGPHPIPDGGFIACFLDPEGHLIGIVQQPPSKQ